MLLLFASDFDKLQNVHKTDTAFQHNPEFHDKAEYMTTATSKFSYYTSEFTQL